MKNKIPKVDLETIVRCTRKSTAAFKMGLHYRIIAVEQATSIPTFRYFLEPLDYNGRTIRTSCRHLADHFEVSSWEKFQNSIPKMPPRAPVIDGENSRLRVKRNSVEALAAKNAAILSVMRHRAFVQFGER